MDNGIIINGERYEAVKINTNTLAALNKCAKCALCNKRNKRYFGCLYNNPCNTFSGGSMVAYFVKLKDQEK